MRTSGDSSQPEGSSLESCCSASSAHGTARTEAQRLGLLACLATSKVIRNIGDPFRAPSADLLPKCERLQIAGSQKGLAWKAVAQPHCPLHCSPIGAESGAACLSCHLKLQTQPGNGEGPCQAPFAALLRKCERLQIAGSQNSLAWKAVAQRHLLVALLAHMHRDWGGLLVLPPRNSDVTLGIRAGQHRQPCSEIANVCR